MYRSRPDRSGLVNGEKPVGPKLGAIPSYFAKRTDWPASSILHRRRSMEHRDFGRAGLGTIWEPVAMVLSTIRSEDGIS